jgi:branched-chain amino acid transport system permease protein
MEKTTALKPDASSRLLPFVETPALLIGLLFLIVLLALPFTTLNQIVAEMMIRVVLVVGIYIFVGNSGILSFGHISFMSIGAFAFVWLSCCTLPMIKPLYLPALPVALQEIALPSPVGIAGAAALGGAVALLVGAVLMRLSGTAASIATFALLAAQYTLYLNWNDLTAGTSSLANVPIFLEPKIGLLLAALAILLAWVHQESRWGVMLRAARDDQTAAKASGINVWQVRTLAFALSGFIVGIGGAMQAGFLGVVTVDTYYLELTFMTLAMLIVGGSGSLSGAVIGVVAITLVTEVLRRMEAGVSFGQSVVALPGGFQEIGLGLAMIVVMIVRPAGIMGGKDLSLRGGMRG